MGSLLPGGFGTPTNEDGRPWLWFMSIIGCSYSMLALAARFMAKWEALGIEDAFIGLSYVRTLATRLYKQLELIDGRSSP